jgi:hypothetical protein
MSFDTASRMVGEKKTEEMEAFLDACGASGPLCFDLGFRGPRGASDGPSASLSSSSGRHADADLCLDHGQVSRRHAYLQLIGGRLFCVDLGSRTGTTLASGGAGSGWVERASPIEIGPMSLRLREGDRDRADPAGEPSPLTRPYLRRHPLPGARLEIASGKKPPTSWRIGRALVLIGRLAALQAAAHEPRLVAVLLQPDPHPAGVWMVDLLATECVLVNGESRRWARLEDGR